MTIDEPSLYYLPGNGGRLNAGLGLALQGRGYTLYGRETVGDFKRLAFIDQTQVIANDLQTYFWHHDAHVIANSFGAYLFLHAQSLLPSFPGKVLLLSPVVGGVSAAPGNGTRFQPPFSNKLLELAEAGHLAAPDRCVIHVGADDWQCPPDRVRRLANLLGIPATIVPQAGHMLEKEYVNQVLDRWLEP